MGRTRNKVQKPSFWETPNPNARQFGRLYPDLDKHPSFTALNFSARCLYLSMIQASAGKREFHFTVSEYKSRGWNATTFTRASGTQEMLVVLYNKMLVVERLF